MDNTIGSLNGPPRQRRITIEKYKRSRFWAIWVDDELLAVTVYRKGAREVAKFCGLSWVEISRKDARAPD